MSKELLIKSVERKHVESSTYDAFVATIGYEKRAGFISQSLDVDAKKKFASAFDARKIYDYQKNWKWFAKSGFDINECSDQKFESWWRNELCQLCSNSELGIRLCIDISSMSRLRIAAVISAILDINYLPPIEVDFLYAPARFSKPNNDDSPITISEPVIDKFAGWSTEPEKACVAIFGLGYEADKAVGAMEYLEPAELWAFTPNGEDARYDQEVKRANVSLWDILPKNHIYKYDVSRPFECLAELESLTYGALRLTRPVLIPFGPKIFTLCCLLVASIHYPKISVWRVSSGQFEPAINRIANGSMTGLRVAFRQERE